MRPRHRDDKLLPGLHPARTRAGTLPRQRRRPLHRRVDETPRYHLQMSGPWVGRCWYVVLFGFFLSLILSVLVARFGFCLFVCVVGWLFSGGLGIEICGWLVGVCDGFDGCAYLCSFVGNGAGPPESECDYRIIGMIYLQSG